MNLERKLVVAAGGVVLLVAAALLAARLLMSSEPTTEAATEVKNVIESRQKTMRDISGHSVDDRERGQHP